MKSRFFLLAAVASVMFFSGVPGPAQAGNIFCDSAGWLRCDNGAFYNVLCSNYCIVSQCDDSRNSTTDTCAPVPTSPPVPRGQGCNAGAGSCPNTCTYVACPANKVDANDNAADGCETDMISYTLTLDPSSGYANKGDVKASVATVVLNTGAGSASFGSSGAPAGTTVSFSPASCALPCSSNVTVTTTAATPPGAYPITVTASSGSYSRQSTYSLNVLADSCDNNGICASPETQSSCASDCFTTASMTSPVTPGQIATIEVEFWDFRYRTGDKVKIDLLIDGSTTWNAANGCYLGSVKIGPTASGGATKWPTGTVSEDGHFKTTALCTVPSSIASGAHTLFATPTIF